MPALQISFVLPLTGGIVIIPVYGLCFSLAFLSAIGLAHFRAASCGLEQERLEDLYVVVIVSAIAGARALFVWLEWDRFSARPIEALRFWSGGLVFFGGLAGAVLASLWFVRRRGLDVLRVADLAAPSLSIGQAIGRLGCFANGCCFGQPSNLPWACRSAGTDAFMRHPTQLYESAGLLVMLIVLLWAARRVRTPGWLAVGYLLMGAALRFSVEVLRGDDRGGTFAGGLSISQLISVCTFLVGLGLASYLGVVSASASQASTSPGPRP